MIVYLDQNKWIELAKMVHGKDSSIRAKNILRDLEAAIDCSNVVMPLSAIHYMETARVTKATLRSRLGMVMWHYSKGNTIAAYPLVVRHELEVALSKHFSEVHPRPFQLLGRGSSHAFGVAKPAGLLSLVEDEVEKSMLMGNTKLNIDPPFFQNRKHQNNFKNHLTSLHPTKKDLPKEKWENWLYAILTADIAKPLHEVVLQYDIPENIFERLGEQGMKSVIDDMPTRHLDLHLHKQVLRNPNYAAKITDLEDWTGVGVATCYCDVVVCEKHMADMLRRDGFKTKARVETDLEKTFISLSST
jgi:hypothetical protein